MVDDLQDHPLVRHYLRDRTTSPPLFREATAVITRILVARAAERLETETVDVTTPLEVTKGARVSGPLVLVPILRAGLGMLDAARSLLPNVSVGYVGMERDENTSVAVCYYNKTPDLALARAVFLIDPMLATGESGHRAVQERRSEKDSDGRCHRCTGGGPSRATKTPRSCDHHQCD